MAVLILILLLVAAVTGALSFVLKIALAVALGVFLGVILLGVFVMWRVRRALGVTGRHDWQRGSLGESRRRWRRVGSSRVEVLDRRDQ